MGARKPGQTPDSRLTFWAGWLPALIVGAGMAISGWLVDQSIQTQQLNIAAQNDAAIALSLANALSEVPLDTFDASASRLLDAWARAHSLSICELSESDGSNRLIASPETLTQSISPDRAPATADIRSPGTAPIRTISIRSSASTQSRAWSIFYPAAGMAAAVVLALFYSAKGLKQRIRLVGIIANALRARAEGDHTIDSLTIAERLGPEAIAWNTLLHEHDKLTRQATNTSAPALTDAPGSSTEALAAACDCLTQGIILINDTGRPTYANGAATILLDLPRRNTAKVDLAEHIASPDATHAISAAVAGRSKRRTTVLVERELDNSDAPCTLRLSIRPLPSGHEAAAVMLVEDITQQRVADEARSSFVAQATHELRTPLTNIRLYVEEAIDTGHTDPSVTNRALNVINQESRRLERIVGDMLSVSEIEAGSLALRIDDIRLDTVLPELQEDFRPQAAEKKITLEWDLPPKLPVIRGDRDKVTLALHNVIGNAIKYTPEGGSVRVKVEADERALHVEVSDTGIGIAPEDASHIFDKFYRAHDKRLADITGSGLGLALAREVARLHGGDITLESALDKGSAFTITIPSAASTAAAA